MKKKLDYLRFKLGMAIAFKPHNKTLTEVAMDIRSRAENQRCVHCLKNPYFLEEKSNE